MVIVNMSVKFFTLCKHTHICEQTKLFTLCCVNILHSAGQTHDAKHIVLCVCVCCKISLTSSLYFGFFFLCLCSCLLTAPHVHCAWAVAIVTRIAWPCFGWKRCWSRFSFGHKLKEWVPHTDRVRPGQTLTEVCSLSCPLIGEEVLDDLRCTITLWLWLLWIVVAVPNTNYLLCAILYSLYFSYLMLQRNS